MFEICYLPYVANLPETYELLFASYLLRPSLQRPYTFLRLHHSPNRHTLIYVVMDPFTYGVMDPRICVRASARDGCGWLCAYDVVTGCGKWRHGLADCSNW